MENNSQCYSGLQFCTFNCRSVKNCIPELQKLCDINDIVFLQEHWLLPDELHLLNNIHLDFFSYGLLAVDISQDILVGRPYGGTAILYRKNRNGSHVFCCFIDFKKAFDRVDYWLLFCKLIIIIIIDNRGLNARWCLTPFLLSLPTAAYLGQRGLTPAGLSHTTAHWQCSV